MIRIQWFKDLNLIVDIVFFTPDVLWQVTGPVFLCMRRDLIVMIWFSALLVVGFGTYIIES